MFKLIFAKELKEIIQSSRFTISFAVCSVLIILSFYMGAQNYLASLAQYEAAVQENNNQIAANTDWQFVNHSIMLPPQPLMALVNGVSNDIGRNIEMRSQGELRAENTRFNDEPIFAIFRFMDLEFIFGIILSLFAIIFAYDAINGEKISGTLKLCFANPLSRASFISGKLAGSFLGLSIALLIPMLIGCALLPLLGIQLTGEEWIRLGLILIAGLAYFGLFLALAIGISAITSKPSNSFLLCLVIWIFAVLIIPRGSVLISGRIADVPNVDQITAEKNRYRAQLFAEDRPKMADFSVDPQTEPMDVFPLFSEFMNELGTARQEKIDVFNARLNEEFTNKRRRQEQLALSISRVSPTSVFTLATTELAGTSLRLQNQYMDDAYEYQNTYASFMEEETGSANSGGFRMIVIDTDGNQEEPDPLDPNDLPQFQFNQGSVATIAGNTLLDFGLLFIFNLVFFGGAFAAFLKYDLR
ncbi:MAG: ABC transporter permease [Balneolales bacterium]|nr:ABC transporter permease [Balneolales bacterium]